MRVACSASLRVTPLETRACLSVSPEDAHRDNLAPLLPPASMPRDPRPPYSIVRLPPFRHQTANGLLIQARRWYPGDVLGAASLLLRFRSQSIEERGRSPVRVTPSAATSQTSSTGSHQSPIADWHGAGSSSRTSRRMCKGPGIRTPAALSVCRGPVIAASRQIRGRSVRYQFGKVSLSPLLEDDVSRYCRLPRPVCRLLRIDSAAAHGR